MAKILLIHGGFAPAMTAKRFWVDPGIVAALQLQGHDVFAPDRLSVLSPWAAEASHIARRMETQSQWNEPVHVIAGSNGCSVAVRLAIDDPWAVRSLVLCWPATCGDARLDALLVDELVRHGADRTITRHLMEGEVLRGVRERELHELRVHMAVMAADPQDTFHRQLTADQLARSIGHARVLPGFPMPLAADFTEHRDAFVSAIDGVVRAFEN